LLSSFSTGVFESREKEIVCFSLHHIPETTEQTFTTVKTATRDEEFLKLEKQQTPEIDFRSLKKVQTRKTF